MVLCWFDFDFSSGRVQEYSAFRPSAWPVSSLLVSKSDWYRCSCLEHFPKAKDSWRRPVWRRFGPTVSFFEITMIFTVLERTYYRNDSKRPAISESKQILYVTSRLLSGILCNICLRKNKSKQSYVWIDSIFEAQNICFGAEIVGLLESFL